MSYCFCFVWGPQLVMPRTYSYLCSRLIPGELGEGGIVWSVNGLVICKQVPHTLYYLSRPTWMHSLLKQLYGA